MPRKASDIFGEFDLIADIRKAAGSAGPHAVLGIGDDAAVVRVPPRTDLLVTTDMLLGGRHFNAAFMTPRQIGKRAVLVNLSDLAAMGASPLGIFCAASFPPITSKEFMLEMSRAVNDCAKKYGARLLGGDVNASKGELAVSITALGLAPRGKWVKRSGAKPGDRIFVTGTLGDAALGLRILKGEIPHARPVGAIHELPLRRGKIRRFTQEHEKFLVRRFLEPEPRLAEGTALAAAGIASSMIDLSDGLWSDLTHILEESGVSAEIRLADLPLSRAFRAAPETNGVSKEDLAVGFGDDYELVFTVPPSRLNRLAKLSPTLAATEIGVIAKGHAGRLRAVDSSGRVREPAVKGYRHF